MTPVDSFLLMVGACGFAFSLWGLARARAVKRENDAALQRSLDAPSTTAAMAKPGALVTLRGRVRGRGGATVVAPLSGRDVLWARSAFDNGTMETYAWVESVDEIEVDDGSGTVAIVPLGGATVRVGKRGDVDPTRVWAAIATRYPSDGTTSHGTHSGSERTLMVDDDVELVGSVAEDEEGYRAGHEAVRFRSEGVQISRDADVVELASESRIGFAASGLGLAVSLVVVLVALLR
jgi:hypothetical protein